MAMMRTHQTRINPSVELDEGKTPEGWSKVHAGLGLPNFVYPGPAYDGEKGVSVSLLSLGTSEDGWEFDPVSITPGETYVFSNYYRSSIKTRLKAKFVRADKSVGTAILAEVPPSSSWKKQEVEFTVPADVVSGTISHQINIVGTLDTDLYSLTLKGVSSSSSSTSSSSSSTSSSSSSTSSSSSSSSTSSSSSSTSSSSSSSDGNLLSNPSFTEGDGVGDPASWARGNWGVNAANFIYPVQGRTDDYAASVQMTSYNSGDAKWYHDDVPVIPDTKYYLRDYYKSTVPTYFEIRYTMSDGTYNYIPVASAPASATWTPLVTTFQPPAGAVSMAVYHLLEGVGTLTVDDFSLEVLPDGPGPDSFDKGYVTFTFDDGKVSNYDVARPILNAAGLKGTFYLVTHYLSDTPTQFMSILQMFNLFDEGHEIGSHSQSHPHLPALSDKRLEQEVAGSLDDFIGYGFTQPVETFCYPYGEYDANVVQTVVDAGYRGARTVNDGYNDKTANPFLLKTKVVYDTTTAAEINDWIDQAEEDHTWLILNFHETQENPTDIYGTTPAVLQAVVDHLVEKNTPVITMGQGMDLLLQ